ncbi:hypothetical protein [Reinekea blandensis]|uniref:Uncharacterized protein n=1 Tax=Reinekea blandensis MED297 TaxID=314283 RepID=A4B9G6_9GAMM|nr:hypothetical protein [Reinekea blandensis]EAR11267.1 hypothetical protein MED297_20307 [Reinekea sp. MED297] [Reinekea blandensis MED297]
MRQPPFTAGIDKIKAQKVQLSGKNQNNIGSEQCLIFSDDQIDLFNKTYGGKLLYMLGEMNTYH